jgi:hypothetical protein
LSAALQDDDGASACLSSRHASLGDVWMLILSISLALLGAVLGTRFKVLVLLPVIGFVAMSVAAVGVARDNSLSTLVITMVSAIAALQVGYLFGVLLRAGWNYGPGLESKRGP